MDGFHIQKASIPANHMNMVKFSSGGEIGYQRVVRHIKRLVEMAEEPGKIHLKVF